MALPQCQNQRWSLDFLSDAFSDGRRFRILAIVDDFTRECLALVAEERQFGTKAGTRQTGAPSPGQSKKQSASAVRLMVRPGGYRERSTGRVSVMGRNALDAFGQQIN